MRFGYFTHVWGKRGMTPNQRYEQLWREIQTADEMGFDYAFSVEHHFSPAESWMSAPNIFAVSAAARTKRIRVGAMGHVVPLHHPVRLLEEVALTDQITNGRVEVGLVQGITDRYFKHFEANFNDRRDITQEFARFMKSVYLQGAPANWASQRIKVKDLELSVWPVQKPHPPMWMETGDPKTLELCAELGMHTGYFLTFPRAQAPARYGPFIAGWKKHGHPGRPNVAYSTVCYVDETDEAALAQAKADAGRTYRFFFSYNEDWDEIRKRQKEYADFLTYQKNDPGTAELLLNILDPDYLIEKELVLIGSPDTVAKRLRKWSDEGLINTFLGEFNFGDMPEAALLRSIRLFGEHVIPKLRDYEPF